MNCETESCPNRAEYYDPEDFSICRECAREGVEAGEYELEDLEEVWYGGGKK